jgi:hypothetical protein
MLLYLINSLAITIIIILIKLIPVSFSNNKKIVNKINSNSYKISYYFDIQVETYINLEGNSYERRHQCNYSVSSEVTYIFQRWLYNYQKVVIRKLYFFNNYDELAKEFWNILKSKFIMLLEKKDSEEYKQDINKMTSESTRNEIKRFNRYLIGGYPSD